MSSLSIVTASPTTAPVSPATIAAIPLTDAFKKYSLPLAVPPSSFGYHGLVQVRGRVRGIVRGSENSIVRGSGRGSENSIVRDS